MSRERKSHRLFFAVELSPSIKTQLISIQDKLTDLIARPVAPENFHITLSFLGNASEKQLENILDGIQPLPVAPFEIKLHDLIFWPKQAILALAIDDNESRLSECKKCLEQQLSQLGFFAFDRRKYIPHITLFRQVETPPEENLFFDATIKVDHISLIASQNSKRGVYYQTLECWPLEQLSIKQQLLGK